MIMTLGSLKMLIMPSCCLGAPSVGRVMMVGVVLLVSAYAVLQSVKQQGPAASWADLATSSGFISNQQLPCVVNRVLSDRGASVLHSWTDDELLERAAAVSENFYRNLTSGQMSVRNSDETQVALNQQNHEEDIAAVPKDAAPHSSAKIDANNITESWYMNANCILESNQSWNGKPKIAFLFLTTNTKLPLGPFWNIFFKGNEDLYRIYVHSDPLLLNVLERGTGVFWGRFIPSGRTQHGTASLIQATRRLLANALFEDPLNEYFALVSEHCIPLYSFRYIYDKITASNRSFLEMGDDWPYLRSRYEVRGKDAMLPEVPFSEFRMGSQFWVLMKKHALMIIRDRKYWNKFKLPCFDPGACYPEEHYFPTMLHILDPNGSTGTTLTYVNWKEAHGPHPKSYRKEEISKNLIADFRRKKNSTFVFARKFDDDCLPVLLELASFIFQEHI